jgi:hypothetical protein
MRFKSRSLLLALLAVFAIGATAATAASASVVWTKAGTPIKTGTKVGVTNKLVGGRSLVFKESVTGAQVSCKSEKTTKDQLLNSELKAGVLVGETTAGTIELTGCSTQGEGNCQAEQPVILEGSTSLALATIEGKEAIVSVFWPKGGGELTPAQVEKYEGEKAGKAKEQQEKVYEYGAFGQSGSECEFKSWALEGDGAVAEVLSDSESATSVFLNYPNSTKATEVTLENGLKMASKLKLQSETATLVGESTLSLEEGTGALGVEK